MQLIDTHTHIYLPEFDNDRETIINRAIGNGVVKLFMPNIDTTSVEPMLETAKKYPDVCYPMAGLHPTSVKEDYHQQLAAIENLHQTNSFIAIGEIGIDLYWDKTFIKEQIDAFRHQCEIALKKNLPVVIHSRDSFWEVFSVLDEFSGSGLKGVFHAFTGNIEEAEKAINFGFKIGIGGIITFKNTHLDKVVKTINIRNIILETDSPYLAPVPYRGKRNESSYLCIINRKIAEIKGMTEKETADITFSTSEELFNLNR